MSPRSPTRCRRNPARMLCVSGPRETVRGHFIFRGKPGTQHESIMRFRPDCHVKSLLNRIGQATNAGRENVLGVSPADAPCFFELAPVRRARKTSARRPHGLGHSSLTSMYKALIQQLEPSSVSHSRRIAASSSSDISGQVHARPCDKGSTTRRIESVSSDALGAIHHADC